MSNPVDSPHGFFQILDPLLSSLQAHVNPPPATATPDLPHPCQEAPLLTPLLPQRSPLPPQNTFSNACYAPFLDSSVSLHGPEKVRTSLPGMPGLQRAAPPSLNITHRHLPSPLGSTHRTTPGGKPLCSFFPLSLLRVSAMLLLLPGTPSPGAVQTQLKYCHPRKLAFTPSPQQD